MSGQPDTVSVVIPSYNSARFVPQAIESAEAQNVTPHEIIVVDDGSTDDTASVLAAFGSRIRVVSRRNGGLPAARNSGSAVATGSWLAYLDADDTWLPAKLERQLEVGRDPRVALIYTDRLNVGARGQLPERQSDLHQMYSGDIFVDLMLLGNRITASSALVRRDVYASLGGFAEHLRAAEDWDLWIRLAETHRVGVVNEPLTCYTFHAGMMSGDPERMRIARRQVITRGLETKRGAALPRSLRRKILAAMAKTNAWDASRKRAHGIALAEYAAAFRAQPGDVDLYREFARYVLGRHS